MTRIVTALYDTMAEAELALAHLNSEVSLDGGDIVDRSPAGAAVLERVNLSAEERASCAREMEHGGYLLIAQVKSGQSAERIVRLLEEIPPDGMGKEPAVSEAAPAVTAAAPVVVIDEPVIEEQPNPIVEEELRLGKREVVRGGARVRAQVSEHPAQLEVEMFGEHAGVERRLVHRRLSEEELEHGGLLRERMFEFTEAREEAIVSKEAFVREQLIVKKSIERHTQRIEETVRRTEVETERLGGAGQRPAFSGFAAGGQADPALRR